MKAIKILSSIILTIAFCASAMAQNIKISGCVTDENDDPLLGVTVFVKNSNPGKGTITDVNGIYNIETQKGVTLVFSFIGYKTVERKVDKNVINVKLQPDEQTVDEVVVTSSPVVRKSMRASKVAYSVAAPAYNYDAMKNEEYNHFKENRFIPVKKNPLSTFSLDVDGASYSNARRSINNGNLPEKDAVRAEEFVNYFGYDYEKPKGDEPLKISYEVNTCPWNTKNRLVRIGVKAKEIPSENLAASNFVFLIDVSGSMMGPRRLDLVKSSMKLLVNNLRDKDRVAIVTYAGVAGEVLPSTSGADKQKIKEALDNLTAGGSTAGGAGIELAYKIAKKNFIKGGNNRIILCTDGDFNVGVSSNQGLEDLIENERKNSGVFLTVLGYGMGNYKDSKMQILAEKGNGNHSYIDNLQEANKVLVGEFGSTMYAVAKDVKIQVEFNPAKVNAYRLVGYESRLLNDEDFNDDTKDAGELGAGHSVTAFYEIVPFGVKSNLIGSIDPLKYQDEEKAKKKYVKGSSSPDMMTIKLRYKNPDSDKSKKIEIEVIDNKQNNPSADFRFASAAAMFAQLLRNSDFKGTATYDDVINEARKGFGDDRNGYRHEFVRIVETVKSMSKE